MVEKLLIRVAWLLPRQLAYWAFIRVATHASVTDYSHREMESISVVEIVNAW